jgi:hypothetical protein
MTPLQGALQGLGQQTRALDRDRPPAAACLCCRWALSARTRYSVGGPLAPSPMSGRPPRRRRFAGFGVNGGRAPELAGGSFVRLGLVYASEAAGDSEPHPRQPHESRQDEHAARNESIRAWWRWSSTTPEVAERVQPAKLTSPLLFGLLDASTRVTAARVILRHASPQSGAIFASNGGVSGGSVADFFLG